MERVWNIILLLSYSVLPSVIYFENCTGVEIAVGLGHTNVNAMSSSIPFCRYYFHIHVCVREVAFIMWFAHLLMGGGSI